MKQFRGRMGMGLTVAAVLLAGVVVQAAEDPALVALKSAAAALKEGQEARAWELYVGQAPSFAQQWVNLDSEFVIWVADNHRKQKQFKDALTIADTALGARKMLPEQAAQLMLVKGDTYRDQQNFASAKLEYESIDRNPDLRKTAAGQMARFRIVDVMRLTRDFAGADALIERLKDITDTTAQAEAYFLAARIAFDREDLAGARENLVEVKRRVPDHVETVFLEAELNLREDRLQDPELEIGDRVLTTYVVPGRPMTMKMQDRNLAVVRGGGGIPVECTTLKGKDREIMNLLPSPRDPTLFRGMLNTKLGAAVTNDMRLQVMGDDVVVYQILASFQKENNLKYAPKTMAIIGDGDLTATAGEFLTAEDRDEMLMRQRMAIIIERDGKTMSAIERIRDPWLVRPGNPVRIQVTDYDRDISAMPDSVGVRVEASSGDAIASVALAETEAHSGIFRGILKTSKSPPRATASDSAPNVDPNNAIVATSASGWKSAPRNESNKWFEVDLMTIQPLLTCELDCTGGGVVTEVSLHGQAGTNLALIASTKPTPEQIYGYVDLAQQFGVLKSTAAYLYTEVTSETNQDVVLKVGADDGVLVWVNGQPLARPKPGARPWKPEEDLIQAPLKTGRNGILLRVLQNDGPWGASLSVVKADGKPLTSMPTVTPAAPGVVTRWHVFSRPMPEEANPFGDSVSVDKPVRVKNRVFRWIARDVSPVAGLTVSNGVVRAVFPRPAAYRRLRWTFVAFEGQEVAVKKALVKNTFGAVVVPSSLDASKAAQNDILELGPGDKIAITYVDEHRILRDDNRLHASLKSGFFDAQVKLAYETIELTEQGEREIVYDPAFRFRVGVTPSAVCHVTDYDADVSDARDKVPVLVTTSSGAELKMEALESEPHSGEFLAILRLGAAMGPDTIKVAEGDTVFLSYSDEENSDGRILRVASMTDAPADPPELLLYQTVVVNDDASLLKNRMPTAVSRPMPGEGLAADKPLATSMDTAVVFKVMYPGAALSQKSVYKALLTTERQAKEAAAGGTTNYTDAIMQLTDATNGDFEVAVDVRVGDPTSYVDSDRSQEALGKSQKDVSVFFINSGDIVRVLIPTTDGAGGAQGWFKMASDGSLQFTDRRYLERESQMFAGDYTYLRLADKDMDVSEGLDTVSVNLMTQRGSTPIALTEILPHAGVFSGRVKTEFSGAAPTAGVLPVQYGETVTAEYSDVGCVTGISPRKVTAQVQVYKGDDARLAVFTKHFSDEDIAVKTRLLMAESLFELAKEHRDTAQKDLASAEIAEGKQVLEEAIADYPDTVYAPHAEFLLGNLSQELEKYEEALERYNKVLSNWPDSEFAAKAQLRKGICLEKTGDMDNALDAYVELTYSYPRSPLVSDAIIRLAQHFYKTKEYEVAGKVFGSFQQRNPDHELAAKALFLSAQSYMKGAEERKATLEGHYDVKAQAWLTEAIAKFEKLIGSYEDKALRAESMYWLSDCHSKNRDMKSAYVTLKRLTWDYPETKWAKFARGQLLQNAYEFKKYEGE